VFGNLFDCGCDSRKEVISQANWYTDLAILVVIAASVAAVYVGLKGFEVIE